MIKKIVKLTFIMAVAVTSGYTAYNQSQKTEPLSDLALANVEALAQTEGTLDMYSCHYYGCQFAFFMQCRVYQYGQYKGVCDGYRG